MTSYKKLGSADHKAELAKLIAATTAPTAAQVNVQTSSADFLPKRPGIKTASAAKPSLDIA